MNKYFLSSVLSFFTYREIVSNTLSGIGKTLFPFFIFFTDFFFGMLSDMSCDLSIDTVCVSRLKSDSVSAKASPHRNPQP